MINISKVTGRKIKWLMFLARLAVDMKFPIHIYIHIHRRLACTYAALNFRKIGLHQCNSVYLPPPEKHDTDIPHFKLFEK